MINDPMFSNIICFNWKKIGFTVSNIRLISPICFQVMLKNANETTNNVERSMLWVKMCITLYFMVFSCLVEY